MAEIRGVPPGRAGRLWLGTRLRSARLAADLLDRKLRVLRAERDRFALLRERAQERWRELWRDADRWTLRAAMTAGLDDPRLSAPPRPASVNIDWTSVMGVRYPASVQCDVPVATG